MVDKVKIIHCNKTINLNEIYFSAYLLLKVRKLSMKRLPKKLMAVKYFISKNELFSFALKTGFDF